MIGISKRGMTVAIVAALAMTCALAAQPVRERHVEAELVSETASIRPGEPFQVALRLKMEKGWHTYWRNPGDAGLATSITWELPAGFTAGAIQWPHPITVGEAPELSYGYEGEVLLLSEITPPASLPSGGTVELKATTSWLVCKEVCISGKANVKLALPVLDRKPRANVKWRSAFGRARDMLPAPLDSWKGEGTIVGEKIVLRLTPIGKGMKKEITGDMVFFASEAEVIDHSAEQNVRRDGETIVIELERSSYASKDPERLHGVVVTRKGRKVRALEIDVELRSTKD